MDALAITDKLIASGAPEPQARAQAQIHEEKSRETKAAIKEVAKAAEGFVTRAELFNAISEFRREMSEFRREMSALREDNAKLRQEMADRDAVSSWRAAGLMIAMTGVFSIIVKLL